MKDYSLKDYGFRLGDCGKDLFAEISPMFVGEKIIGKSGDIYEISSISNLETCDNYEGVCFHVNVKENKTFISWALGRVISVSDGLKKNLEEVNKVLAKLSDEYKAETKRIRAVEAEEAEASRVAKEKEEKAKKAEIKRQAQMKSTLKALEEIKPTGISKVSGFYQSLGWLYSNTKSIIANVPDFCERWFEQTFGTQPHFTVDTSKPTEGGYLKKWNCSFQLNLKTSEGIPEAFAKYATGKKICNTELIYDLVINHGFQFGSKQNIDRIMDEIPADKLDDFKLGLTA